MSSTTERPKVDAYANRHTRTAHFTCPLCIKVKPQQGSRVRRVGGLRRHVCGACAGVNVGGEGVPCGTGLTHTTTATPQGVASTDQLGRASEARN